MCLYLFLPVIFILRNKPLAIGKVHLISFFSFIIGFFFVSFLLVMIHGNLSASTGGGAILWTGVGHHLMKKKLVSPSESSNTYDNIHSAPEINLQQPNLTHDFCEHDQTEKTIKSPYTIPLAILCITLLISTITLLYQYVSISQQNVNCELQILELENDLSIITQEASDYEQLCREYRVLTNSYNSNLKDACSILDDYGNGIDPRHSFREIRRLQYYCNDLENTKKAINKKDYNLSK